MRQIPPPLLVTVAFMLGTAILAAVLLALGY